MGIMRRLLFLLLAAAAGCATTSTKEATNIDRFVNDVLREVPEAPSLGIAVVRDDGLAERLQLILNSAGAVPGPFDAWLVWRGTKVFHLCMPGQDE